MKNYRFINQDLLQILSMKSSKLNLPLLITSLLSGTLFASSSAFYLPENPEYTIFDSTMDSIRFTLTKTLKTDEKGHLVSISSFVDPEGNVMGWHDFGNLEGPGWAANAVGGAWEIYNLGKFLGNSEMQSNSIRILDHILDCGFIDEKSGFIRPYRETTTGKFCLNYKHNSEWLCPGSIAKIGYQILRFAEDLENKQRSKKMKTIALRCAEWIDENVENVPNGWFPRRTLIDGKVYKKSPEGGNDPFWQSSADSLFILQLQAELTEQKLADYKETIRIKVNVFTNLGGIFGSINHDTYDANENVAYSVAFRTLLQISRILNDKNIKTFAYENCLAGLEQFKMSENRNNVATKGLLYMEKSWDTAYLWENAEAALAYFEAAVDTKKTSPQRSRVYELNGLTILRAIAKHHYGPYGFLTEGVDWNNHVGQQHHINQEQYGAIKYTEPFLNNQHITEPTLFYLNNLVNKAKKNGKIEWRDIEGNLIYKR